MKHLDEGTIHAWLDGELGEEEGAQIEAHLRDCEACSAQMAEARGLVAASSRILAALDDVSVGIVRPPDTRFEVRPVRRRSLRIAAWLAAAAVVVAVGVKTVGREGGRAGEAESLRAGEAESLRAGEAESLRVGGRAAVAAAAQQGTMKTSAPGTGKRVDSAARKPIVAQAPPPKVPMIAFGNSVSRDTSPVASAMAKTAVAEAAAAPAAMGAAVSNAAERPATAAKMAMPPAELAVRDQMIRMQALGREVACFAPAPSGVEEAMKLQMSNRPPVAFVPRTLRLDPTPVGGQASSYDATRRMDAVGAELRQLRDSSGVIGAWRRVGVDSIELRIGEQVVRGMLVGGEMRVEGVVMREVDCK